MVKCLKEAKSLELVGVDLSNPFLASSWIKTSAKLGGGDRAAAADSMGLVAIAVFQFFNFLKFNRTGLLFAQFSQLYAALVFIKSHMG